MDNGFFKKNKVLSINMLYIASLLPIIIFSYIKNGISVVKADFMNGFIATQYLIIPIIIVVLSYIFEAYYYLVIKKEEDLHSVVNSLTPFINVCCYLVCGPANPLWLTIPLMVILDVLMKFIDNTVTVNRVALFKVILFGALSLMALTDNANVYEASLNEPVSNVLDLFLGQGIGEIGTTSTLFALIGFVILLFNSYYKKDISVVAMLTYAIVSIILYFASSMTFTDVLVNTFNSGFVFVAVFVASMSQASPVVRSGRLLYAVIFGISSAILIHLVKFNLGIYIAILVLSLLTPLFNKFKISLD